MHHAGSPGPVARIALVLLATTVSVGAQRFRYGHANNVYHIPIVLDLPSLPQFAADPFYATLDRYASAVYPVLALIANEANVSAVFFAAHFVTRALTLYVLLMLALRLVPLPPVVATCYLIALGIAPALLGVSPIGQHEIMPLYFTHSSLVLPFATAAIIAAAAANHLRAGALGGLTFCVNAFAGVWTAIALAAAVTVASPTRRLARAVCDLALTAAAFVVAALPVLWWLVSSGAIAAGGTADFEFRAYLFDYYRFHTWILGREPAAYARLAQVTGLAVVVFASCRPPRAITAAYAAFAAVFLAGGALPYLTTQRALLNFYPLRADALLVYIGVGVLLPGIMRLAAGDTHLPNAGRARTDGDDVATSARSPSAAPWPAPNMVAWLATPLVGLATGSLLAVGAVLALLLLRQRRNSMALVAMLSAALPVLVVPGPAMLLYRSSLAFAALLFAGLALLNRRSGVPALHAVSAILPADLILGGFTRSAAIGALVFLAVAAEAALRLRNGNSENEQRRAPRFIARPFATLLLCTLLALCVARSARQQHQRWRTIEASRASQVATAAWARSTVSTQAIFLVPHHWSEFQWRSLRRVWIDWKQGAAPMWAPEFYPIWVSRFPPVAALSSVAEVVDYGCAHRVDYIVVIWPADDQAGIVFRSGDATVLDAARACMGRSHAGFLLIGHNGRS